MEPRASLSAGDGARPGRGGGVEASRARGGGVEASRARGGGVEASTGAGAWATALVVDDEVPALDELTYLLRTIPVISSVHAARSSSEALRSLQERRYDVVFLDVRMPSLNGIELANVLGRFATPPAIVFVTAYEQYAVRAFDIGACDYLLKPVSRSRLSTALDRALRRSDDRADEPKDGDSAAIPLETAGRVRWVTPGQVRWVEAEGDYVRLYMTDGDAHLVRMPISHLEEKWVAHGFIRIHRSYLVPISHVAEFAVAGNNHSVKVSGRWLPVSRRHARDVRDRLLRAGRRH